MRVRLLTEVEAYGVRHPAGTELEVHAEREYGIEVYFGPGRTYVGTVLRSDVAPADEPAGLTDLL